MTLLANAVDNVIRGAPRHRGVPERGVAGAAFWNRATFWNRRKWSALPIRVHVTAAAACIEHHQHGSGCGPKQGATGQAFRAEHERSL